MIDVVAGFLGLLSASIFLAHAIEAYNSSKKQVTVLQKTG